MIGSSLDDGTSSATGTEPADLLNQSGLPNAVIKESMDSASPIFRYVSVFAAATVDN